MTRTLLILGALLCACSGTQTTDVVTSTSMPTEDEAAVAAESIGDHDTIPMPEEVVEDYWTGPSVSHWEIMSHDPDVLVAFYSELFGWNMTPWHDDSMYYTMAESAGAGFGIAGGIGGIPEGEEMPEFLSVYITVMDIDQAVADAEALGAQIVMPPMDIPDIGSAAMFVDPGGALMGFFQPPMDGHMDMPDYVAAEHPVVHWEIGVPDAQVARTFYTELLGWTYDLDEEHNYASVSPAGPFTIGGGITQLPEDVDASYVTFYVGVDDLQATLDQAAGLGATVVLEPTHVTEGVDIAMFLDPAQNPIGIILMGDWGDEQMLE